MSLPEKYDHPLYKHVKDEKEADAVAWAWVNKEKCVKFPFKFPELGPKELRANILYLGISILMYLQSEKDGDHANTH